MNLIYFNNAIMELLKSNKNVKKIIFKGYMYMMHMQDQNTFEVEKK